MVTAIITTYQRDYNVVRCAIESIIHQTYHVEEIIVVDDNKNDNPYSKGLINLCKNYSNVKYIKQAGNKGACAARNLGIENAKGDYIAFLDDDDLWLPKKIEKQLRVFSDNNDELGLVFCSGWIDEGNGSEYVDYFNKDGFISNPSHEDMLVGDWIGSTSQPLIRKECFEKLGGFWEEQPARQDYEMWIRISTKYQLIGLEDRLFIHSLHQGEQISKSAKRAYIGMSNIYERYKNEYQSNRELEIYMLNRILAIGYRDLGTIKYITRLYWVRLLKKTIGSGRRKA